MNAFVLRSERVVTGGELRRAAIHVDDGRIRRVAEHGEAPAGWPIIDVGSDVVLPGLVDSHVHINEPGRAEWEGFQTATRAAAAGGITSLVDMPLNSIPATTTVRALEEKRAAAAGKCFVDVGFWGGVVPGNAKELRPLVSAGALGFKCFLIDSGVAEFRHVSEGDLREALVELKEVDAPLLVHAELPGPVDEAVRAVAARQLDRRSYRYHLESRPRSAENEAVALMVGLCREHETRTHIVHHCSCEALSTLARAKDEGLPLTVETCPHYLTFAAEEIPDGATWFKCTPPIRERDNREQLWGALASGVIDAVVSDHSPCSPALKGIEQGDFEEAWGGVSSLQLSLPVTWSGARAHGASLVDVARWMCAEPARLSGLGHKGAIAAGNDADLVVFAPDERFTVDPRRIFHHHALTPYAGRELYGVVRSTYLRGACVYDAATGHRGAPAGKLLGRGP